MKEAKENSEKLANTAEEMANAKEYADTIIDELQSARDILLANIQTIEDSFFDLDDQISTLRFQADQESDEKEKAAKEAAWE